MLLASLRSALPVASKRRARLLRASCSAIPTRPRLRACKPLASSVKARWRQVPTIAGAWLAFGCRVGSLDVPIGSDLPSTFYVGPEGDDLNPGTHDRPWKTLKRATDPLGP